MTHTLGVIGVRPMKSFIALNHGLGTKVQAETPAEYSLGFTLTEPESVKCWPRIRTAIRRSGLLVVEMLTPEFSAVLRFDPEHPDTGDYEIHRRTHGEIEEGHTTMVIAVAADEKDSRLSMLKPFTTRYAVTTVGATQPYPRLIWRIGLNYFGNLKQPKIKVNRDDYQVAGSHLSGLGKRERNLTEC